MTNLDAFFCKVYTYYVEKGFWCMIAARITNLLSDHTHKHTQVALLAVSEVVLVCMSHLPISRLLSLCAPPLSTLAFTISFSTFLLLFVNWHAFFFCDSGDCDAIVSFRAQVFTRYARARLAATESREKRRQIDC